MVAVANHFTGMLTPRTSFTLLNAFRYKTFKLFFVKISILILSPDSVSFRSAHSVQVTIGCCSDQLYEPCTAP